MRFKQGTTARQRRGSGEARATVECMVGGTGGQGLDCLERQAGFGQVAETRETGLLSFAISCGAGETLRRSAGSDSCWWSSKAIGYLARSAPVRPPTVQSKL